jgi:hypothetical protein
MSWNGTVHCGHCGTRGHNKTSCQERKKYVRDNPDSYAASVYNRAQRHREARVITRACSYCKQLKHNRRSCKVLKEDKDLIAKRQQTYLDEFLLAMSSTGFGIGSLIKMPRGSKHDGPDGTPWSRGTVEMVVGINWDNIDFMLKDLDLSRDWSMQERQIAATRIVSLFGYNDEADPYCLKQNDKSSISAAQLFDILPAAFNPGVVPAENRDWTALLVAPVKTISSPPTHEPLITFMLNRNFNLTPRTKAHDYEKRREPLSMPQWSMVRKSEHEKARL